MIEVKEKNMLCWSCPGCGKYNEQEDHPSSPDELTCDHCEAEHDKDEWKLVE